MIDGFSLIGANDSFLYGTAGSVRQEWVGRNGQFFFQFGHLFLKTGKLPFFSMACKLGGMEKLRKGFGVTDLYLLCRLCVQ
ncbi:hypothetical protein [uncultured Oxalobacter sp.]|uniref:hypothetical protein n=1 Tax=uncultured Oxalobacter sp. TaxID=337245 RepID=UPI0025926CB4|nr:hypothetical protein [uncultured Oxalobacter sp.]